MSQWDNTVGPLDDDGFTEWAKENQWDLYANEDDENEAYNHHTREWITHRELYKDYLEYLWEEYEKD